MNSKEYWDKKILEWEDSMKPEQKVSFVERLASFFRNPMKVREDMCVEILGKHAQNKSITELGCGSGYFAFRLFAEAKPKSIVGVDISQNAISRANMMNVEFGLTDKIKFVEKDVTLSGLPKSDITIGLGFLDYLTDKEIVKMFNEMESRYFLFSFPLKNFSIFRLMHILYLIYQKCPKHFYYTKRQMVGFVSARYPNPKVIISPKLLFGGVIHNFED